MEGTWYRPALPGPLITATTRLRDHAISRELYGQQITARCPCQLKHKDGPGTDRRRQDRHHPPGSSRNAISAGVRPRHHTQRQATARVLSV